MYVYGTVKPVEFILRRGRGMGKNNGGDEPNPGTCTHIWKYHNKIPCVPNIIYSNKT
jgi:hypothetical protein